jgi:predicted HicB family RNase H-like nuclease
MPVSKSQQRAVTKYMKNNYDEIKIRVPKGNREKIKAYATSQGESLNAFVKRAIEEAMNK